MRIQLSEEASTDLAKGILFYETQARGLGAKFLQTMESAIESLRRYGGIHARDNGYQRLLVRKFPFAIYYQIVDEDIEIVAVIDGRRDSDWIARRLGR